jgi:two-component system, response regulator
MTVDNLILLVEDEPDDAFFFQHCLREAGIANRVSVARDGLEALDYLKGIGKFADRETHPLPCLVVLDLKLPRATGFEVLEQMRLEPALRRMIVLVLTSSSSDRDIVTSYDLGANAYLVKPSDSRELVRMVQTLRDFWLTYNRPPPPTASTLAH